MLEFAGAYRKVAETLPVEPREVEKLPRGYIANIINTLVGDPFQRWVETRIADRHQKVQLEQNMTVNLDPEIAAIFRASTCVSGKWDIIFLFSICFDFNLYDYSEQG